MTGLEAGALFAPLLEYDAVGLAVSGGADSLALMLLAEAWATTEPLAPKLFVYTVDHGLRPEAAGEAAFVVRQAQKLGFTARALRWEGEKHATGIQEAARFARYGLIAAAMRADGAKVLLTAHHLHDQAETVLMRLAHGSGIEGLRGMDHATEIAGLRIVRPLLGTDPAELRRIVDAAGLVPVADPSNADPAYERVRWRNVMPQLAALGLDAARIAKFANRMRDADRALDSALAEALQKVALSEFLDQVVLDRAQLVRLPRAIAVRVVQWAIGIVGDNSKPHMLGAIEALTDELIRGTVAATLGGCLIRSDKLTVQITTEPKKGSRAASRKLAAT